MKKRMGYVSNSSSSSFIVDKSDLTDYQINALMNISVIGYYEDIWDIYDAGFKISGFTAIDNGCEESGLYAWMVKNKFPMEKVKWTWN